MLTIPQCDPRANYLAHTLEIDAAIQKVLTGGRYILGENVAAFETEFANYIGSRYAVAVASGTDALHLALRASGIAAEDQVITVSHTAVATVAAVELAGAQPVLIDVDPDTFTMDVAELESAVSALRTDRLKAIIPVHLYGQPADMLAIKSIANQYNLRVIEDCCQSHGAQLGDQKTGAIGDAAAFSFYPTKNLSAIGDGGMVVTDDHDIAKRVRLLREYGWEKRYVSSCFGTNSRLDEIQAAILRVKLQYLDDDNRRRQAIAGKYDRLLAESGLKLPRPAPKTSHVFHQYVVRTPDRESLRAFLQSNGIGTLVHYPMPVHQQPGMAGVCTRNHCLAKTEEISLQILSLPMYPELTDDQVMTVSRNIIDWSRRQPSER